MLVPAYLAEQEGSVRPVDDPQWDDVVLLREFAGANGATPTDNQAENASVEHTLVYQNGLDIQNDTLDFDGSNDFLAISDSGHDDFRLTGDFCIELFGVQFDQDVNNDSLFSQYQSNGDNRAYLLVQQHSVPDNLKFVISSDGFNTWEAEIDVSFAPATDGTRYDICVERESSTIRVYIDGTVVGTDTYAGDSFDNEEPFRLGTQNSGSGFTSFFDGKMQAVRFTRAVRYGGAYTVPLLPLPKGLFKPVSMFAHGEDGGSYVLADRDTVFSDLAGTTQANADDPLGVIADQTPSDNDLIQGGANNSFRPVLRESGGLWWSDSDGTDDRLSSNQNVDVSVSEWWMWAALSISAGDVGVAIYGDSFQYLRIDRETIFARPEAGTGNLSSLAISAITSPAVFLLRVRQSDRTVEVYRDGSSVGTLTLTGASWWPTLTGLVIHTGIAGAAASDSNVYACGFIDRALTAREQTDLTNFLTGLIS